MTHSITRRPKIIINIFNLGFFLICAALLVTPIFILNTPPVYAEDTSKSEAPILDSAEKFFIFLKEGTYKNAWELLSEKSQRTIINDVYKASHKKGVDIKKEEILKDFNSNGVIFNNYWSAFLNNFDPDIVLNERVWEFEKIEPESAVILLKHKSITKLQMYKENNTWKVGFVETFWKGKIMKFIAYLNSLFH